MLYFGDLSIFHNLSFTGARVSAVFPYSSSANMTGLGHKREEPRHCSSPLSLGHGVTVAVQKGGMYIRRYIYIIYILLTC